jgi:uncharacterized protein (TIGR03435 family)
VRGLKDNAVVRKALVGLFVAGALFAQTPAGGPAFEVATIKPTAPDWSGGRYIRMKTAHELEARNHALKTLLAAAYDLSPQAISGVPDWSEAEHYDIVAKTPGETHPTLDQQMAMLRRLLDERFHLVYHREPKEMSIYSLTVAKGGSKLREPATPADALPQGPPALAFVIYPGVGAKLPARNATVGEFASVLQRAALSRPVIDQTGINGRYDFDLEFVPEEGQFGLAEWKASPDHPVPGLFAAVEEQLGLKLEATRGPVNALVVDKAGKPSEN